MSQNLHHNFLIFGSVFFLLVALTGAAIACRFYVRVHMRGNTLRFHKWGWSDRLLIFVWLGYVGCSLCSGIPVFAWGYDPPTIDEHAGEKHFPTARKLTFAYLTLFWAIVFILKGAMLCFFDEFVSKGSYYKSWVVIRIIGVLVFIGGTSSFIYSLLWCTPFHKNLDGINKNSCWLEYDRRFHYTVYRQIWHVVLDLMILCVPLPLIPMLKHVSMRQFVGLVIMLALGLFCVISAIVFTLGVLNWDNGSLQSPSAGWFLNYEPVVEMAAAILIQCIPAIRFLLREQGRKRSSGSYGMGGSWGRRWSLWSRGSRDSTLRGTTQATDAARSQNVTIGGGTVGPRKADVVGVDILTFGGQEADSTANPDNEADTDTDARKQRVHDVERGVA